MCGCKISSERRSKLKKFGFVLPQHYIKAENNPDYFDAIPKSVMKWRCSTSTLSPEMKEKYERKMRQEEDVKLEKLIKEEMKLKKEGGFHANSETYKYVAPKATRKDGGEIELIFIDENDDVEKKIKESEKKQLVGHESYNMTTSLEYSKKFGFQTDHMKRIAPSDWIFSNAKLKKHDRDIPQIVDLIKRCTPFRNSHGRIPLRTKVGLFVTSFIPLHLIISIVSFFPSSCSLPDFLHINMKASVKGSQRDLVPVPQDDVDDDSEDDK
jgi:hypothetical protein